MEVSGDKHITALSYIPYMKNTDYLKSQRVRSNPFAPVACALLLLLPLLLGQSTSGENIYPHHVYNAPDGGFSPDNRPWWETTSMDLNRNGIFDSLESLLDGRRTVDVFVDYDHVPTPEDVALLRDMGFTTAGVYRLGKAVGLNDVPSRLVRSLPGIPGVVMVEPAGTPLLFSDIATPNAKARPSEEYSPYTAWEMGVRGRGINIAVVDTGIDDAHPSLQGKFVAGVDFSKPEGPLHPRDGSFNPDDTNGHGTTCSGIATGTGAPDGVYTGAAPEAMLVDVRIGTVSPPGRSDSFPPTSTTPPWRE